MKKPEECFNMQEIRNEIDILDQKIIKILGKRFQYVKAAAKFKTSATAVKASERFKSMLEQRRKWAQSENLSPDVVENIYRDLVNYFIEEELKDWRNNSEK